MGHPWRTQAARYCEGRAGQLVLVSVLLVGGAALLIFRLFQPNDTGGAFVQADFERAVGRTVALAVQGMIGEARGDRVGILVLFRQDHGSYRERLGSLREVLEQDEREVDVFDALTGATELYGDTDYSEDYSPSIDRAIQELSPDVLVVLAVGGFTNACVSETMQEFIERGGRFVFVGEIHHAGSPLVNLIRDGKATAVVRNAGVLAGRRPKTRTLGDMRPKDFVHDYYTVLTAENVEALLNGP